MRQVIRTKHLALSLILLPLLAMPAATEINLPTLDSDEVTKATGVYPDTRSNADRASRVTYLLNHLLGIAREAHKNGKLSDSLAAYKAAAKLDKEHNNGNFFRGSEELGYLYGDMGNWTDAKRIFDNCVTTRWKTKEASDIAKYCLQHNQVNIAYSYRKVLSKAVEDPDITLVYSKVLVAAKNQNEAINAAKRAYYLAACKGLNTRESQKAVQSLTGSSPVDPNPNRSAEPEFWIVFDRLTNLKRCPDPAEAKKLVDPPTFINGAIGYSGKSIATGFQNDGLNGAIRRAVLQHDREYYCTGLSLQPNILNCSLDERAVRAHLNKSELEKISKGPSNDSHQAVSLLRDNCLITFGFEQKGFHSLSNVSFQWKEKGQQLIDPSKFKMPERPSWSALFKKAQTELKKKRFSDCRAHLCRSFVLWADGGEMGKEPSYKKRREIYESFKREFHDLYSAWGKEDIAEYFPLASFPELQEEVRNFDCELIIEFPSASEFRHQKWSVTWQEPGIFNIEAKLLGLRMATKEQPIYAAIAKSYGALEPGPKEIYPPAASLIDDEIFQKDSRF